MAHNYYRIPIRIRNRALTDMAPSEGEILSRSRCRRHRRKLRYLLHLYELRQKKAGRWMETHIWHSKRFKMESKWGVSYPVRCSDKSDRSTYRLTQKDSACIMDQSYYSHFQIGPFDSDLQLQEYLQSQFGIESNLENTRYSWDSQIYDSDNRLIAPCHILCTDRTLILCVHPSVT